MARIGFDIDGVLADFNSDYVTNYLEPIIGRQVEMAEITDFWYWKCLPVTEQQFRDTFAQATKDGIYRRLKPYNNGFLDRIRTLLDEKNEVVYITTRPLEAVPQTYEWFFNNDVPLANGIYFTDKTVTKQTIAKVLNLDAFVEDNVDNANSIAQVISQVYLINRSYNVNFPVESNVIRTDDLSHLERTVLDINNR